MDHGTGRHFCHLLGLSLIHACEPEEALRVARLGLAFDEGRCNRDVLVALATPLPDSPGDAEPHAFPPNAVLVREVLRAMKADEGCLARGDAAGARAAMSCLAVASSHAVQSLARRAEARLIGEEATEPRRFDKAFALASFHDAHADRNYYTRRELPIPWGTWDTATLDDLARRAALWLDATLGGPWAKGVRP